MTTTKNKKQPATETATEPTTAALTMKPAGWTARPEHATLTLGKRLTLAQIIGDDDTPADPVEVDAWLRDALKDDEREAIGRYVAAIEWLDVSADHGAFLSQVTVPDALAPRATPWTRDPVEEFGEQIVFDAGAEPAADPAPLPAPPVAAEPDGQLVAVTEPEKPKTLKPMTFRTGEEVGAVRRALESEMKELEKMAKDSEAIGEPSAAKIFRDKALLLKTQLIPQVTAQQNLPFNEKETLPGMIARTVAGEVRSRAKAALLKDVTPRKGESRDDAVKRQMEKLDDLEALIGNIGEQVGALCVKFVAAAADRGMLVGKQALAADGATVAREAMQLVEFELQQGRAAA